MKKKVVFSFLVICSLLYACSSKNNEAKDLLNQARNSLNQQDFTSAKAYLDSLETTYPKAFNERLDAIALLDTIRRTENDYIIKTCDSLLLIYQAKVDSMKTYFIAEEQKDETKTVVSYSPREGWTKGLISQTTLRPRVMPNGEFRLESYFVGPKQLHDRLELSVKGGNSAESLPIEGDGFNFRFSNLGKHFEIMTVTPATNNGLTQFITENKDKTISVKLSGSSNYQYTLPTSTKKVIIQSIDLSAVMQKVDSLNTEKEKAGFRNYNLDLKQNVNSNTTNSQMKE